jgi:hypothetical protein
MTVRAVGPPRHRAPDQALARAEQAARLAQKDAARAPAAEAGLRRDCSRFWRSLQDAGHLPRRGRPRPDELRTELRAQAEREADAYRHELAALQTGTSPLPAAGPIGHRENPLLAPAARPAGGQGRSQDPPACRPFRLLLSP